MLQKKVLIGLAALGLCNIPMIAFADLVLANRTNEDSTSIINNGWFCSSMLDHGVTKAGEEEHKIDDKLIKYACSTNLTRCKIDVFMTDNCKGPIVATVIFNANNQKIQKIDMMSHKYLIVDEGNKKISMNYRN